MLSFSDSCVVIGICVFSILLGIFSILKAGSDADDWMEKRWKERGKTKS